MRECYVILGTTRSGTSVVTGVLHRLGVVMGWELIPEKGQTERYDWPDAYEMNPTGFFQDAPLENCQDAIWGDDYPLPGSRPPTGPLSEDFKHLIRIRCERKHPKWGFKASRTPWMIPELIEACADSIRFIVTRRDPSLSARSLHIWFGTEYSLEKCNDWVQRSNQQIENVLAEYPKIPRHVVEYDLLHDFPEKTVAGLAAFAGVSVTASALDLIDPSLRRVR